MAFKKGISGNPGGKSGEKIFTEALRVELKRVDPKDKQKRQKLNVLAEKLVECALKDKQAWAFQQIADRLVLRCKHIVFKIFSAALVHRPLALTLRGSKPVAGLRWATKLHRSVALYHPTKL